MKGDYLKAGVLKYFFLGDMQFSYILLKGKVILTLGNKFLNNFL